MNAEYPKSLLGILAPAHIMMRSLAIPARGKQHLKTNLLHALAKRLRLTTWVFVLILVTCAEVSAENAESTVLGIDGSRFTLNGKPTFLLGVSYYGGLGASGDSVRRDLDELQHYGFNWLRVWATWDSFGEDVSAIDSSGNTREPYMQRLEKLVSECDHRGLVVDVTLTRGKGKGRLPGLESHKRAINSIKDAIGKHRNWYLDLANERDVHDERYVSIAEVKALRAQVRKLDASRLVTASFGGHDLDESDIRDALVIAELDFLCPHRPRHPESPSETEAHTRECIARMKELDRVVPVLYQEPFRRGYTGWEPAAADFLQDLRGAVAGGAAGWCFHNGAQASSRDGTPRRSFDLRNIRLVTQLDKEELKVLSDAAQRLP